jgi:hypothetical protein
VKEKQKELTRVLEEKQIEIHQSDGEEAGEYSPACWRRSR